MKKRPLLVITGTVLGTVGVLSYAPGMTTPSPLLALSSAAQSTTSQSSTPQAPTSPSAATPTSTSTQSTPQREKKATTKAKAKATAIARAKARAKAKARALTTTSSQAPVQTTTHTPIATTAPATSTRKIDGSTFQTPFGPVQVQITVQGTKIISVSALQSPQGGRSSYISQQAVPYLIQETLAAQSANIQGVGGATYTSEGWAQSLQAALAKI